VRSLVSRETASGGRTAGCARRGCIKLPRSGFVQQFIQAEAASRLGLIQALGRTLTALSSSQTKFNRDLFLFILGKTYTREQINAALGGSTQACIPTLNGLVLSVCVTPELNPRAPSEILCGVGPIMARTGAMLAAASYKVPFFIKRRVNKWEYMGLYLSVDSYAAGARFNEMVNGSGRSPNDVSLAIDLQPWG